MNKKRQPFSTFLRGSLGIFVIIAIALAVIVILSFLLSKTPLRTLRYFFLGPLQNRYYFGNMLNTAIPLIFGGLGFSLAMRAGSFNLGGEGQLYSGAFVATISALFLAQWGVFGVILALFLGSVVGGLIAGLSGVLKMRWNTNELITTFLVSYAVVLVVNYLIAGPFLDTETNLIATKKIPENFRFLHILKPSNLSIGILFALLAIILVHLYLYKTKSGYELIMVGLNPRFARYGGIRTSWYRVWPMFLSGAFFGLGGGMTIFGTYYACMKDFSVGMGWNGLAVALIARYRPAAIIPAALFFAYIESGARNAMMHSDVTFEIASIVQSVVFFLVTSTVLQQIGVKKRGL
ncbi:MAG: ABC transporter permease [Sphaerochaetaceae bacterium]|jgi:simple sugar transport system permease protein|nr:ABC transporter permease [Sphaerochaetaceae bacterium]MDD3366842.1 ABC transporter permease [Sphaerochaetaceae bacterium]MDD4219045.1 ABC transporter permease [Sphaerochaetaceae bacterium]MDY0371331.1 ABC transporter permease [Sphaerochaetaceae bacterium]